MAVSAESSTNTLEFGSQSQNLVSKKKTRYRKLIIVFGVIAVLLIGCVLFTIFRQETNFVPEARPQRVPPVISQYGILHGLYEPARFNGTWISDDEILTRDPQGNVYLFNVTNKSKTILLGDKSMTENAFEIQLSADKKYLMIAFNTQKMYRHSFYAYYLIYDIQTQKKTYLSEPDGAPLSIQLVKWAPEGNGYVYVFLNDVYYKPGVYSNKLFRITNNGNYSTVYNGICDWVYEEEIFSDTSVVWFSPDASKLTYASFNDAEVDIMTIPFYGEPGSLDSQYPRAFSLRYPKPGRKNPVFSLNYANLKEENGKFNEAKKFTLPSSFSEPILNAVAWISNENVLACVMNRVQNKAVILSCNTETAICTQLFWLESNKGWVEFNSPKFSPDGAKMLFIQSQPQDNESNSYKHLVLYDITRNETITLTKGKFTVTEILSWDELDYVYYTATEENEPTNQHVYKIKADPGNSSRNPECVSCTNEDKECTFSGAAFSKNNKHYVQSCSGPGIPVVSIFNKENKKICVWEDNKKLQKVLENATLPEIQFLKVPVASGMEARVKLVLPVNMDKSGNTKYPLLINVYGGPNSNQVFNKFRITWETYFNMHHDVIIAFIDGRGSGLKGDNMLFANYRKLGTAEIIDQINVTSYLQNKYSFIDRTKTAIWGWSYGGYATGMALAMDVGNVFACGVSVAPVTDWIYYDSMYTERYMGLPTAADNENGYMSSSLIKHSPSLRNKKYLLIHGTLDDNVHYQQSMMLARSLELQDILFKQQSYPDEVHGLNGVKNHFYHTLEQFLMECFI